MVDRIQISPKQPSPKIVRKTVIVDGEQVEQVRGDTEYRAALIPDRQVVTAELKVDGVVILVLGPWPAESRSGKAALAQLRLRVTDNADPKALDPPAEEPE